MCVYVYVCIFTLELTCVFVYGNIHEAIAIHTSYSAARHAFFMSYVWSDNGNICHDIN